MKNKNGKSLEQIRKMKQKDPEYAQVIQSFSKGFVVGWLIGVMVLVLVLAQNRKNAPIEHVNTNDAVKLIVSTGDYKTFPTYLESLEDPDRYYIDENSVSRLEASVLEFMEPEAYERVVNEYKDYRLLAEKQGEPLQMKEYTEHIEDNNIYVDVIIEYKDKTYPCRIRSQETDKDGKVSDIEIVDDGGLLMVMMSR